MYTEIIEKNINLIIVGANGRSPLCFMDNFMKKKTIKGLSYRDAGVDIDTKGQFTTDIYSKMRTTFRHG